MKNRVLMENHLLPGDLERQIGAFVNPSNTRHLRAAVANACAFRGGGVTGEFDLTQLALSAVARGPFRLRSTADYFLTVAITGRYCKFQI